MSNNENWKGYADKLKQSMSEDGIVISEKNQSIFIDLEGVYYSCLNMIQILEELVRDPRSPSDTCRASTKLWAELFSLQLIVNDLKGPIDELQEKASDLCDDCCR